MFYYHPVSSSINFLVVFGLQETIIQSSIILMVRLLVVRMGGVFFMLQDFFRDSVAIFYYFFFLSKPHYGNAKVVIVYILAHSKSMDVSSRQ